MAETLESAIDRVRVYRRGATVTRRCTLVASEAGTLPASIRIGDLPLALDDASVRIATTVVGSAADSSSAAETSSSSAHVRARALRVGLFARRRNDVVEVPNLDRLDSLEREQAELVERIETLNAEIGALGALPVPERPSVEAGQRPPASPLRARLALDAFVGSAQAARADALAEAEDALQTVTEQVRATKQQLIRFRTKSRVEAAALSKSVTAELDGSAAPGNSVVVELSYFVDGAQWTPEYQCRVARDGSGAQLVLRAAVCQATGEDWSGVRVECSTAERQPWTELPTLPSLRIGRAQPPARDSGFRPPPPVETALFAGYDAGRARLDADGDSLPPDAFRVERVAELARELESAELSSDLIELLSGRRALRTEGALSSGEDDEFAEMEEADSLGNASGFGGVAAPAPKAAPASMSMPPPAPRMAAPRRERARGATKKRKGSVIGGPGGGGQGAAPEPGFVLPPAFGDLVLGAPDDAHTRGRLEPIDMRERYRASIAALGLSIAVDPLGLVADARTRATAASTATLPPGSCNVGAVGGVFDYTYVAEARLDVPADGSWHSVALGTREAVCSLEYVVVPRVDTAVFRILTLENPDVAPLLPGRAELYVDGEYVLTTDIPYVAARGEFRVGLGVEQAIKCARNTSYEERRAGDGVVATAELHHGIAIEIVNTLDRSIDIEVRERIPQPSEDAEVVVEEGEVVPVWSEWEPDDGSQLAGGRAWRQQVDAGDELQLDAAYVVKIYAQNQLVGGNRREQ